MNIKPFSVYRPAIRGYLDAAMHSASRAESTYQQMSGEANGADTGSARDPLSEATRDTVEIDSSRFGQDASGRIQSLQSIQSSLGNLGSQGRMSGDHTLDELSGALAEAQNAGAPAALIEAIERATGEAKGAADKGESATSHVQGISGHLSYAGECSADVASDQPKGDWSGGDVSGHASSAMNALDQAGTGFFETDYAARDASTKYGYTQNEIEKALNVLNGVPDDSGAAPAAPTPVVSKPVTPQPSSTEYLPTPGPTMPTIFPPVFTPLTRPVFPNLQPPFGSPFGGPVLPSFPPPFATPFGGSVFPAYPQPPGAWTPGSLFSYNG